MVQKKIIFLSIVLLLFVSATISQAYRTLPQAQFIVGGQETEPGAYPFMVALLDDSNHYCGGTLIAPQWVATAAHCVDFRDEVDVLFGRHDLNTTDGLIVTADEIYLHPSYSFDNPHHDLALLHLSTPVTQYKPIGIATDPQLNLPGRMTKALGWGRDGQNTPTETLHEVDLPIMSNPDCDDTNFDTDVTDVMLCSGLKVGRGGACFGDSGGPVVTYGDGGDGGDELLLLGVTSWGSKDCFTGRFPSVQTRITSFTAWIEAHLNGVPPYPPISNGLFLRTPDKFEPNNSAADAVVWDDLEDNIEQTHSLHTYEDVDWYTFTITEPMEIQIEVQSEERRTYLSLMVFDEEDNVVEVARGYGYDSQPVTVSSCGWFASHQFEAGTYHVRVYELNGNAASNYTIRPTICDIQEDAYEPDDLRGESSELTYGDAREHTISSVQDVDWFTFTLTETRDVLLTAEGDKTADTKIALYDENGSLQALDNDGGYQFSAQLQLCGENALLAGTYYAFVSGATREVEAPLTYEVALGDCSGLYEPNDDPAEATHLTFGSTQPHRIEMDGDQDWLTIVLTETTGIFAQMEAEYDPTSSLEMTLYDGSLDVIATGRYNDSFFRNVDQAVSACGAGKLAAGTYYIHVEDIADQDAHPRYTMSLEQCKESLEPNDSLSTATSVDYDETAIQVDSISYAGDTDWYVFTVPYTTHVGLMLTTFDSQMGLSLYDGDGNLIVEDVGDGEDDDGRYIGRCNNNPLPAGTYSVRVNEIGDDHIVPEYMLIMEDCFDAAEPNDTPSSAIAMRQDDLERQALSSNDDEDWFMFILTDTSKLVVHLVLSSVDHGGFPQFTLYDSEFSTISHDNVRFCGDNALAAGQYFIKASEPNGELIPAYSMMLLECTPTPNGRLEDDRFEYDNRDDVATPLGLNERQTHNLSTQWDQDVMALTLATVTDVLIEVDAPEGDTTLTVSDPTGAELWYSDDVDGLSPSLHLCDLPPGRYTIIVQEFLNNELVPTYDIVARQRYCGGSELFLPLLSR